MAFLKSPPHHYRIESRGASDGALLADSDFGHLYADPSLAVAVAVKSVADPSVEEVRVVHIPSGEVVFKTTSEKGLNGR
jgi:hypothetical protein